MTTTTGLGRKDLIRRLNREAPSPPPSPRLRAGRPAVYGEPEQTVIRAIWRKSEHPCGKRLKAMLEDWMPHYEKHHGLLDETIRLRILKSSPATLDRLLAPDRLKAGKRRRGGTKPGTLIRERIAIRTNFWDVKQPGFIEADTVAHCGDSLSGSFIYSLTLTDIHTGWTEIRAVWNKGAAGVIAAVAEIEACLAFPILGFDSDNGSEFMNHHLLKYWSERDPKVSFTRTRAYHPNDNAHVEQKQYTHVRQLLGYGRLDDSELLPDINALQRDWSLFHNFFCSTRLLISKVRVGAKIRRIYSEALSPYRRLLACPSLSEDAKQALRERFQALDPFELKAGIEAKLRSILRRRAHAAAGNSTVPDGTHQQEASVY